jgi:hypothetical protein
LSEPSANLTGWRARVCLHLDHVPGVGVGVVSGCGVGFGTGVALGGGVVLGVALGLGEAEGEPEGDFL